jgi:hypothetical protein
MGVFYHCPTSFTTMGVKILAGRPDEKDFFFSMPTTLVTTPDAVKCNPTRIFTLAPVLTVPGPVLY